jgi:hypothetical protein
MFIMSKKCIISYQITIFSYFASAIRNIGYERESRKIKIFFFSCTLYANENFRCTLYTYKVRSIRYDFKKNFSVPYTRVPTVYVFRNNFQKKQFLILNFHFANSTTDKHFYLLRVLFKGNIYF